MKDWQIRILKRLLKILGVGERTLEIFELELKVKGKVKRLNKYIEEYLLTKTELVAFHLYLHKEDLRERKREISWKDIQETKNELMETRIGKEIRHQILEAIIRGIEEDDEIVGIAIVIGEMDTSVFAYMMKPLFSPTREEWEKEKREIIERAAGFISRVFAKKSKEEYIEILSKLETEWNKMPPIPKIMQVLSNAS